MAKTKFDPRRDWEKKQATKDWLYPSGPKEDAQKISDEIIREEQRRMAEWAKEYRTEEAAKRAQKEKMAMETYTGTPDAGSSYGIGVAVVPGSLGDTFSSWGDWTVHTIHVPTTGKYNFFAYNVRTGETVALVRADEVPFSKPAKPSTFTPGVIRTEWLKEAHDRCMKSEKVIRVQLETHGLVLIATEGNEYCERVISWDDIEAAAINIILPEIELIESEMGLLFKLKEKHVHKAKTA